MSGLLDDGPGLMEAEEVLSKILKLISEPSTHPAVKLACIENTIRTYFLDQLSRESHEFEP